jgi:hypothetical protein
MRSNRDGMRAAAPATAWLFSQGLGVLCGQATVLLLAIGSVVLTATREGASASIEMDDVRAFFDPPSVVHLWFYLLVTVLAVYALNTTLATCQNMARKWRAGVRAPRFYAPALIHLAFLLGLLAHGVGGIAGEERDRVTIGAGWTPLGAGREARVTALKVEPNPDGSVKQVRASVQLRDADGSSHEKVVEYNGPLSWGLGGELMLLIRPLSVPTLRLARGADHCEVAMVGACELGDVRVDFLYLHPALRAGQGAFAQLRVRGAGARDAQVYSLVPGNSQRLTDGSQLSVEGLDARPAIVLRHRITPGDPLALLASVLLGLGLLLMWRRFIPRASLT